GSKGRYWRGLAAALKFKGPKYFIDERPQSFSPPDIMERGQIAKLGTQLPLDDYAPLSDKIADQSLDFVGCYVGLHHMTVDKLGPFLASVRRVLRPGGVFIVREHDVRDESLRAIVSLAHTVFNAGLAETWEQNTAELRFFDPVPTWTKPPGEGGVDRRAGAPGVPRGPGRDVADEQGGGPLLRAGPDLDEAARRGRLRRQRPP